MKVKLFIPEEVEVNGEDIFNYETPSAPLVGDVFKISSIPEKYGSAIAMRLKVVSREWRFEKTDNCFFWDGSNKPKPEDLELWCDVELVDEIRVCSLIWNCRHCDGQCDKNGICQKCKRSDA